MREHGHDSQDADEALKAPAMMQQQMRNTAMVDKA